MKKVLIITYYWPPSGGPGVQRWVKFVKYMVKLGLEPIVLTVDPEYASYPQKDETLLKDIPGQVKVYRTKSFELYSLYKRFSSNKEIPYGGFVNTKTIDTKEKILRFIRGNLFIPDPRRGWCKYAEKKAKEIIREHEIETVITTSPPHSTQLIGLRLKKKLNIKWIADFRDPWTDIFYYNQLYPTRLATTIQKKLELKVISNCDGLITVSDDLMRLLIEKEKSLKRKIYKIPNGFDPDDFATNEQIPKDEFFNISYVGTLSEDYPVDGLIDGIKQLDNTVKKNVKIRFIGRLNDKVYDQFILAGLEKHIEIIGYVPHKKAIEYMHSSDVLLLVIPDITNNSGILTGKLFEYLAVSQPILLLGPEEGDAAKIIKETHSGVICNYHDNEKITNSIQNLYNKKKNLPKNKLTNQDILKYSREEQTKELIRIL